MGLFQKIIQGFKSDPIQFISSFPKGIKVLKHEFWASIRKVQTRRVILKEKERLLEWNPEVEKCIKYIEKTPDKINVFNDNFVEKYDNFKCEIIYDDNCSMFYVKHEGKKLYYPNNYKRKTEVFNTYTSVYMEQDMLSPHRYLCEADDLAGNIIFDCGSAEASFSLGIIEQVKHIYLFEADPVWIPALKKTFEPWHDKITIINKFVNDRSEAPKIISLYNYIRELEQKNKLDLKNDKIFIKMDIEGAEENVLSDIRDILKEAENMKLAVCVYHTQRAENLIVNTLPPEYEAVPNPGFILWLYQKKKLDFPYFRRGVLRIEKCKMPKE